MRIGVFDSGFGGLTVLRALLRQVPHASYFYLGDSARLPYGSKSRATVSHYARGSARFLVDQGAETLVIACNTATALALDDIRCAVAGVEVIGVIEPGALSAKAVTQSGRVAVIGTVATVTSHAYRHALETCGLQVIEKACPLLVPLVEEGWTEHPVTEQVARIYLDELFSDCSREWGSGALPDTLVLGCTHYPLLEPLLARILPKGMAVVDSADAVAERVKNMLRTRSDDPTEIKFFTTDSLEKFQTLGRLFLGRAIAEARLIHLPE